MLKLERAKSKGAGKVLPWVVLVAVVLFAAAMMLIHFDQGPSTELPPFREMIEPLPTPAPER